MRKISITIIAFTLVLSNLIGQTKTSPSTGTKPATTTPVKSGNTSPSKIGAVSKTPSKTAAPATTAAPAGAVKSEDKVGGVDVFKYDKEQKDYNYNDRIKTSKPLMPSYEYMQPFFEKGKKRKAQQEAYLGNKYYYPSRPKNKWEIGVGFGMQTLFGDVDSKGFSDILNNSGFHFSVRKALSYFISIRSTYQYGTSTNRKHLPDNTAALYNSTSGKANFNNGLSFLGNPNNGLFYPSVQLYNHSLGAEINFTVGNTRFHKERTKFTLDLFVGVSAFLQKTKADFRDANGNGYNFAKVNEVYNNAPLATAVDGFSSIKGEVNRVLDSLLDGTYESNTDIDKSLPSIMGYSLSPAMTFGAGVNYRISKLFNIGILSRFTMPGSDLLDGMKFAGGTKIVNSTTGAASIEIANTQSAGNDVLNYTAINLGINLGGKKALEPLYWQNPIHHTNYKMAQMDPEKIIQDAFKDDDADGVPNQLDKEANTKKGYPVDVQGRALDSDKDGLKDGEDKEPYSLPNYPIDEYGVAIVPPPACCAQMDSLGRMMNGDGSGGGGGGMSGGSACNEITLPGLMYDKDQYGAERRDFIPILHIVGEKLQMCPDAKIVVSGINDKNSPNGKYNEQLSYNRANDAINYLTEKYGISRDRFIMKYNQDGAGDKMKDRKVDFRFAKEGETGDGNPPAPHPGLKAGKK